MTKTRNLYRLEIRGHADAELEWRIQSRHRTADLASAAGRRIQRMLSPGWQWRVVSVETGEEVGIA